jgi:hypothetical protein
VRCHLGAGRKLNVLTRNKVWLAVILYVYADVRLDRPDGTLVLDPFNAQIREARRLRHLSRSIVLYFSYTRRSDVWEVLRPSGRRR